jgi:hypothetical protein
MVSPPARMALQRRRSSPLHAGFPRPRGDGPHTFDQANADSAVPPPVRGCPAFMNAFFFAVPVPPPAWGWPQHRRRLRNLKHSPPPAWGWPQHRRRLRNLKHSPPPARGCPHRWLRLIRLTFSPATRPSCRRAGERGRAADPHHRVARRRRHNAAKGAHPERACACFASSCGAFAKAGIVFIAAPCVVGLLRVEGVAGSRCRNAAGDKRGCRFAITRF